MFYPYKAAEILRVPEKKAAAQVKPLPWQACLPPACRPCSRPSTSMPPQVLYYTLMRQHSHGTLADCQHHEWQCVPYITSRPPHSSLRYSPTPHNSPQLPSGKTTCPNQPPAPTSHTYLSTLPGSVNSTACGAAHMAVVELRHRCLVASRALATR